MSILKLLSERKVLLALMLSLPRESKSYYLLLNFENDNSGLAVKILFCQRSDSANFHFSPYFLPSSSTLSPLAPQFRISPPVLCHLLPHLSHPKAMGERDVGETEKRETKWVKENEGQEMNNKE